MHKNSRKYTCKHTCTYTYARRRALGFAPLQTTSRGCSRPRAQETGAVSRPAVPCRHAFMTDLVLFLHPQTRPNNYTRSNCCRSVLLGILVIRDCSRSQSFNCFCSRAATRRGCGVFGGCAHLKALIQWVAASSGGIKIKYFPFNMVLITFPVFALARVLFIAGNLVF